MLVAFCMFIFISVVIVEISQKLSYLVNMQHVNSYSKEKNIYTLELNVVNRKTRFRCKKREINVDNRTIF